MRRFAETNEAFTIIKRFITNLNKYFNYYINEEIIAEITKLIKCFNFYINCYINEKITKSKAANINYQDLHFAEIAIIKKIANAVIYEVNTN